MYTMLWTELMELEILPSCIVDMGAFTLPLCIPRMHIIIRNIALSLGLTISSSDQTKCQSKGQDIILNLNLQNV